MTLIPRESHASQRCDDTALAAPNDVPRVGRAESLAPELGIDGLGAGARRANALVLSLSAHNRRRGGGGAGRGGSGSSSRRGLLDDGELHDVEGTYPDGITAVQVVDIFVSRGIRFSEATFRKYVQQGLVPRSKRVGRKGKHRGSLGMYPARTVRRINGIKRLMGEGYTIEEIQEQFLRFTDAIEGLEESLGEVFARLQTESLSPRFDTKTRRDLDREIKDARKTADELLERLDELARRTQAPRKDDYRSTGAAGSAEDLL